MQTKHKRLLTIGVGLLLTPVVVFMIVAGVATYDGGTVGTVLLISAPVLYMIGFYTILKGLDEQAAEDGVTPL